jgi:hypothetical protein
MWLSICNDKMVHNQIKTHAKINEWEELTFDFSGNRVVQNYKYWSNQLFFRFKEELQKQVISMNVTVFVKPAATIPTAAAEPLQLLRLM